MSEEHRRRAVEWFLLLTEVPIDHAHKHAAIPSPPAAASTADEREGPALYDTGLEATEGLWVRTGWAGRT